MLKTLRIQIDIGVIFLSEDNALKAMEWAAREIAYQEKALSEKPEDLSLVHSTHLKVEGENQPPTP